MNSRANSVLSAGAWRRLAGRLAPVAVVAVGVMSCSAQAVTPSPPPPPPPPGCTISTAPLPASDATVTVDVSRKFQTIAGFGTSERLFDDPHLTRTFDQATQRGAVVVPPDQ
ncbi:MAG TPA: hypothetical protein VID74_09680, partial [Gemmatimonadales bacterium]